MPRLNTIPYNRPNITEKVNYFIDYFKFTNQRLGQFPLIQFENPLSLIEKVIYQIETNFVEKSRPYLENHFSNSFFSETEFLDQFPSGNACTLKIDYYLSNSLTNTGRKNFIKRTPLFLVELKSLRNELKENLIDLAISSLISLLGCRHKLKHHMRGINFWTLVLVTEFRYRNHSSKDIEDVPSKIMSNDINVFPFSKEIETRSNQENYGELRKEHLKTMGFKGRFLAIKNLIEKESYTCHFLFRINNISSVDNEFKLTYDDVTFISPYHTEMKLVRSSAKKSFLSKEFFQSKNKFIIGYIQLEFYSRDIAVNLAVNKIKNAVSYLNRKIKSDSKLDADFYLTSKDFTSTGSGRTYKEDLKKINERDFRQIDDNPFSFFRELSGNTIKPFLFFEHDYQSAIRENDVSKLWQYLENIIANNSVFKGIEKEVISNILLLNYRKYSKIQLRTDFVNSVSPFSIDSTSIGLTSNEQEYIIRNPRIINPNNYTKKIKRPFVSELIKLYKKNASKRNLSQVKEYYMSLLTEGYELRNMMIHRGEAHPKVELKMKLLFPLLVARFRKNLIDELKKYDGTDFSEVLVELNERGMSLLA